MFLEIIAYKLIVFVEGVVCKSVEFLKRISKKINSGMEVLVSRFFVRILFVNGKKIYKSWSFSVHNTAKVLINIA